MDKEECNVCHKDRPDVKRIQTYNRTFTSACPECVVDMRKTLNLLKISKEWALRSEPETKSYSKFTVSAYS